MSSHASPADSSLKYGHQMVAIPGPSIIPDRVLEAFRRPMPDLYEGPFVDESFDVQARLPAIARTEGHCFIMTGNGHAAWQMATSNTLAAGDTVLALESGRFATVWGRYTGISDIDVELLPGNDTDPVDPAALEERLGQDTAHTIKAILVSHVDTASSVRNDIPALRKAIDAAGHPALLMVDCIASMGCERFLMDEWGVDIAVAGTQKGLMVPPGVSFVWASEKAIAAHDRADRKVGYFDWEARLDKSSHYAYYAGTPPIPHIRALRVALDMIDEEGGLEAVWQRHEILADAVRAAVAAWAAPGGFGFNITDPAARSNCVTSVRVSHGDPNDFRHRAENSAGLIIGMGIGDIPGIRIAHMGHLNPPMILGTLATIEATMHATGMPMGESGIAAAAAVIGKAL